MTRTEIIEQSGSKITVRTSRGDEYVLDTDETAKAVAALLSDHGYEQHQGWSLNPGWYAQEIRLLAERSKAA